MAMRLPTSLHLLLAFLLSAASPAPARRASESPAGAAPKGPPALIVAISVDQFSADLFAQYRGDFTGGLARLQQGAVFPSAYQSHAATETCPGHSTLMTGDRTARTGIIANYWFEPGPNGIERSVYCAEDERRSASSHERVVSAEHLRVPTLGDRLKARDPQSLNVAVSGKDRAAVMMGGHHLDAAYWWTGDGFASFSGRPLARAAMEENRTAASEIAAGAEPLSVPAWCAAHDRAVPVAAFTIGTWRFPLKPGDRNAFRISPHLDAATVDLAARLVDDLGLGGDSHPDILSISLSATDYVGHSFGTQGVEMCIQLAELDRSLARLFDALDQRGIDYVVVLTADHGGIDAPERLREQGYPSAARADSALTPAALAKAVTAQTGIAAASGPLIHGASPQGDLYFAAGLTPARKARATAALVALLKAHPQVAAVFTKRQLAAAPPPTGSPQDWSLEQRARASFDPERSGDVVVLLKRGVVAVTEPHPGTVTTHGSPWDYDRRVPLLFWRRSVARLEQPAPVETVDIAPTLAALLGLAVPANAFDGRCLDIDGSNADSCVARR
jgi:predicted AlkP superfamily pyrophosphatase or phosphodiesterase